MSDTIASKLADAYDQALYQLINQEDITDSKPLIDKLIIDLESLTPFFGSDFSRRANVRQVANTKKALQDKLNAA